MVSKQRRMPLEGIRIIDFAWVQAGPWVGRYFANYGAEVIKVESARKSIGPEMFQPNQRP